jgi:hypothetical protein
MKPVWFVIAEDEYLIVDGGRHVNLRHPLWVTPGIIDDYQKVYNKYHRLLNQHSGHYNLFVYSREEDISKISNEIGEILGTNKIIVPEEL